MSETPWNKDALMVFTAKFRCKILTEGWLAGPKVKGHIQNAPKRHTHKLCLRGTPLLEVQAAHYAIT